MLSIVKLSVNLLTVAMQCVILIIVILQSLDMLRVIKLTGIYQVSL